MVYHLIPKTHRSIKKIFLIFSNFIFYFSLNTILPFLLLLSTSLDYFLFQKMRTNKANKKAFLLLGITINLLPLLLIKLINDFDLWSSPFIGITVSTDLAIPIGISFYSFKSISCLIDSYNKPSESPENFLDYLMYLSFFPELLCGPISRFSSFKHNLRLPTPTKNDLGNALIMISRGLFYKIVIANTFLTFIDSRIFNTDKTIIDSLILGYITVLQVYFDFSGYTEIAKGTAKLFGMKISDNFKYSFLTTNIADFWRRHHISMSTWFRDYVFIPLSFRLKQRSRIIIIIFTTIITFTLSGIWHGFTKGALIFGLTQGILLSIYTLIAPKVRPLSKKYKISFNILGWGIVSVIQSISFSYLLLSTRQIKALLSFSLEASMSSHMKTPLFLLILTLMFSYLITRKDGEYKDWWEKSPGFLIAGTMLTLVILFKGKDLPFIYYQF